MQRTMGLIQLLRFVFSDQAPLWARIVAVIAIGYTIMPFTWGPLGVLDNIVVPLLSLGLIQYVFNRRRSPGIVEDEEGADNRYVVDTDYRIIDDSEDSR